LGTDHEIDCARYHIGHYENDAENETEFAVFLMECYDSLHVEQEWAYEQERDYDLEYRNEEEDILEGFPGNRQRYRVHEIDDDNEYHGGHYENLDLPFQERVVLTMNEYQQVIHPIFSDFFSLPLIWKKIRTYN